MRARLGLRGKEEEGEEEFWNEVRGGRGGDDDEFLKFLFLREERRRLGLVHSDRCTSSKLSKSAAEPGFGGE